MKNLPQVRKRVKGLSSLLHLAGQGYSLISPWWPRSASPKAISFSPDRINRLLVIQLFALGDVLLSLPLVKGLRSLWPEAQMDFWMAKNWLELAPMLPYLDRVVAADSRSILKTLSLLRKLRAIHYDLVFVLYPVTIGSWMAYLSGATYRIGYTRDYDNRDGLAGVEELLLTHPLALAETMVHDTQRYLGLAHHLGLSPKWEPPFLIPTPSDQALAQAFFQGVSPSARLLIGLNPNASWEGKRWPADKFAQLADLLIQEQKGQLLFFGATQDSEYVKKVMAMMSCPALSVAGETSLGQMAALIQACDLFISNDSGPMHMACALNVPTLAIMGPTKIEMFRPWASLSRVVHQPLNCTPCQHENTAYCQHFLCINSIAVEDVYEAVREMIGSLVLGSR